MKDRENAAGSDGYREKAEAARLERIAHFEASLNSPPEKPPSPAPEKPGNIHKGHRKRLRASARRDAGLESFSDVELLELMLSFGVPQRDTNPLAHALLDKFGSLLNVFRAPPEQIAAVPGVTGAAAEIISVLTAVCMWDGKRDVVIATEADAARYFGAVYIGEEDDIRVAYLDGKFSLLAIEGYTGALDCKAIVGAACAFNADYVLVCARSCYSPDSESVVAGIRDLPELLALVGTKLVDCLVFSDFGYYSLGGDDGVFVFYPYLAFATSPELVTMKVGDIEV